MNDRSFVELPTVNLGYASTVIADTPSSLARIRTLGPVTEGGYQDGQVALVSAMANGKPGLYIFQPSISIAPDGLYIVASPDDPTHQWVYQPIQEQGVVSITTPEIDLTQPQIINLIPPMNYKYSAFFIPALFPTQRDGTVTTGPTMQYGTDAGMSNLNPSTVQTTVTSAAIGTRNLITLTNLAENNIDLSQFGLRVQISAGAVLGTATVFKAYINVVFTIGRY